jgi:predicted transcriptional regulator of viral defense system
VNVQKAVINIKDREKVIAMVEANNGFITSAEVTKAGFQRRILSSLVETKQLYRVERGIYALPNAWEDEMFFLQYRFSKGVFSHETALFLHGLSDKTPARYTMTFPHGYKGGSAKESGITVKNARIYDLGIIEMPSPCGNPIRIYDKERTLCDIVKGNNACEIGIVNTAMKTYAASRDKNINRLISYAEQLRVKPKILKYMEVLL